MPCISNHLLLDSRFETVDSKLAQNYFVCYVHPIAERHCILDIFILSFLVKTQLLGRRLYLSYQNLRATVLMSLKCNGLVCRCTKRSISVGLISVPVGENKAKFRNCFFDKMGNEEECPEHWLLK